MAFPVMAALIGAGIGAVGTKMSGGSNRDMIKNALLGAAMGTGVGYLGGAGAASGMSSVGANTTVGMQNYSMGSNLAAKFGSLSTPTKLGIGAAGASMLMGSGNKKTPFKPPFDEAQYASEYAQQRENVQGLGDRFNYQGQPQTMVNNPSVYQMSKGGIVDGLPKYNQGGVSYLPSKLDHDEKDKSNYVRAEGYIEDATDIADKDEDTMLAQLADGEFVSRADAILGAGIMQGANPKDFKDMRTKGAKFFYSQQDQLKRIYDLVT